MNYACREQFLDSPCAESSIRRYVEVCLLHDSLAEMSDENIQNLSKKEIDCILEKRGIKGRSFNKTQIKQRIVKSRSNEYNRLVRQTRQKLHDLKCKNRNDTLPDMCVVGYYIAHL